MKAQDLRIGNWLFNTREQEDVKICAISDLSEDGEGVSVVSSEHYDEDFARLRPIPLTEDWLLKFGLKEVYRYADNNEGLIRRGLGEYSNSPKVKGFTFDSKPTQLVCMYNLSHEIKYVHQLQNLYHALTGKELMIKELAHNN